MIFNRYAADKNIEYIQQSDFFSYRFHVRPPSFFQKCRDQQWYINQLEQLHSQRTHPMSAVLSPLEGSQVPTSVSSTSNVSGHHHGDLHTCGTSSPPSSSSATELTTDEGGTPASPPLPMAIRSSLAIASVDRKGEGLDTGERTYKKPVLYINKTSRIDIIMLAISYVNESM